MGLHRIAEDSSTLAYHCTNPDCQFHNCAGWESWQQCKHHDVQQIVKKEGTYYREQAKIRLSGQTREIPIDHPDIKFTGPGIVALPMCDCGTQMFLKVDFTPEELQAPNMLMVERDSQDPRIITRLIPHPMVARHQQLAAKLRDMGKVYTPPGNE
jgi:hypothetical protein